MIVLRKTLLVPLTLLAVALLTGPSTLATDRLALPGAAADGSADPALVGAWLPPFDGEVPAVTMALLHDGRVLYISGVEANETDDDPLHVLFFTSDPLHGQSRVLDLSTDPPTITAPGFADGESVDLFCAGLTILPDGRVLVAGGSEWTSFPHEGMPQSQPIDGTRDVRVFDPATDAWTSVADMNAWRWYPSVISQADGAPLVASGIHHLIDFSSHIDYLETYAHEDDAWSIVPGGTQLLPLYPRISVLPGGPLKGDVFYNTVGAMWGPMGEHPLEALWSLQQVFHTQDSEWEFLGPSFFGARQHAASVMLPLDPDDGYAPTFVTFGGSINRNLLATDLTEINDLSTNPPTNTMAAPLHHPRWHVNGLLLPDGKVLAVGGGLYDTVYLFGQENIPVLPAEIFDPASGAWTEAAAMEVPRMYHSTALLLPDGRVLVGGHVPLPNPFWSLRNEVLPGVGPLNPQVFETRMEIYEPPYLFRGARPVIGSAPQAIAYGSEFTIGTSETDALDSAVLVRPGATTHAFDSTSRSIRLDVVAHDGTDVTLQAPPDGDVAPPGWYMLFINKAHPDGAVPSEAKWVQLG